MSNEPQTGLTLVRQALAAGEIQIALQTARGMDPSWEKARALLDVAEKTDQVGLMDEASEAVMRGQDLARKADLLNIIAKMWLRAGRRDNAYKSWGQAIMAGRQAENDPDPEKRLAASNVLGQIAFDLHRVGESDRSMDVAEKISDPMVRRKTISAIL